MSDVRHNTSTDRCSHLTKKKGQSYFYEAHENANTPCSLLCGNKYHSVVNTDQKSTHLVEHADDLELSPSYYSLKKKLMGVNQIKGSSQKDKRYCNLK